MNALGSLVIETAEELIRHNCDDIRMACEYLEVVDARAFETVVKALLENVREQIGRGRDVNGVIADHLALAMICGARAARKGLL